MVIYFQCGVLASWAALHTTVCLDSADCCLRLTIDILMYWFLLQGKHIIYFLFKLLDNIVGLMNMSSFPGEDVTWMCSVQSTTDLTITWYINGTMVSSEMGTASHQTISNVYTLNNINYTDSNSVVMCRAAGNSVTVDSDTVALTGRLCYFYLFYHMYISSHMLWVLCTISVWLPTKYSSLYNSQMG